MATSGVATFTVTRDDIIKASLRTLTELGAGETPTTEDYTNCSQALNILLKSWQKKGAVLWKVTELSLPMVASTYSYQIGPTATGTGALVTDRPLRVLHAFIRDSNGYDTDLIPISRQEYDILGSKTSSGIPNQYYFNPQLANAILTVYNVPSDATRTIHLIVQSPIYDMTASGDNFDFPQEWFQALKWGLADELALEYSAPAQAIQLIGMKAQQYVNECFDWSQEEASVFFTPNPQGTIRQR